jgi:glycosyltransferase involved in cell wall biosynthesis
VNFLYNKVIFVCDYQAKYGGNFLSSFSFLAKKLIKNNVKVYFIFPEGAKGENWEVDLSDFEVIYSKFNSKDLVNTVNNCIAQNDFAIVHLNFLSSLFQLRLKRRIGKQAKIVFQQHMDVDFGAKQIVKGIILKLFAPKSTAYIGVSPEVYRDIKKEVGKKKSYLVLNAVDTNRLKPINRFQNSNILIFGTDFKVKGVDIAIKAIQHSKVENKCTLIIVTHNVENARQLILSEFGDVPNFVKIIPPVQNIKELYSKAFLFLSPSRSEAFGYAVVEAAYSGLQVIASDVPGQDTLAKVPGIQMFQSENIDQLRSKINSAYLHKNNNRENLNRMTRQYIDDHFSLDNWAKSIQKVYNSLNN